MGMDLDDTSRIEQLGGGSLLIAWQLKDKNVLIVGGGEVASQRIESILTADSYITVISPETGLHPRTKHFIALSADRISYFNRPFRGAEDLDGKDMVLTALDDNALSQRIVEMCRERRIPVNAADIPNLCDFYFGAQIRDGPLQIMISTNGNGPRMASLIKTRLQKGLSGREGEAITKVGQLRSKLKERAPGVGGSLGRERMKWMSTLCNTWEMEDFMHLDNTMMDKLLDEGWNEDKRVPTPRELGLPSRFYNLSALLQTTSMPIFPTGLAFVAGVLTTISFISYRGRS